MAVRRQAVRYRSRRDDARIDALFRDVREGSLVVDVPEFGGAFEMAFQSHVFRRVLKFRSYEPDLARLVGRYLDPRRDAIDVGANVGLFAVLFAKMVVEGGRVVAIEPTPSALRYLHGNIRRNGVEETVSVFEGVATDARGTFDLNVIPGQEEYSTLGDLVHPTIVGRQGATMTVAGDTIDNIVSDRGLRPGFVKIDTEGAELRVLRGARNTLEEHRPIVICEVSDTLLASFGASSTDVVTVLEDTGYRVSDAHHPARPVARPFVGEVLAVPAEEAR